MAQREIVLQQVRMGKHRDLPLALEKGQISFSTDVARMFIGLPSSSEPASLVAGRTLENAPGSGQENVEILTEFSPWEVVNKVYNKPYVMDVYPNDSTSISLHGNTRMFIDYVATTKDGSILETGNIHMVVKNGKVLMYQINNTTDPEGIYHIEFAEPKHDPVTNRMEIKIHNDYTQEYRVEFLVRGWDELK